MLLLKSTSLLRFGKHSVTTCQVSALFFSFFRQTSRCSRSEPSSQSFQEVREKGSERGETGDGIGVPPLEVRLNETQSRGLPRRSYFCETKHLLVSAESAGGMGKKKSDSAFQEIPHKSPRLSARRILGKIFPL